MHFGDHRGGRGREQGTGGLFGRLAGERTKLAGTAFGSQAPRVEGRSQAGGGRWRLGLLEGVARRTRGRGVWVPAVGRITALTWALEIGDPGRFGSIAKAVSYCGLCAGRNSSAGKDRRAPISKQRNPHLQTVLVEAAKLAPRWSPRLAEVHAKARLRGDHNRATLEVARKMVAWLMAVDRSGRPFQHRA